MSTSPGPVTAVPFGTTTVERLRSGLPKALEVPDALHRIREANATAGTHVVVLDDDPTGSQVVHDVPVLITWADEDLRWAFAHPARAFFILTNTRSLDQRAARALLVDLDQRIARIAAEVGTTVVLLSRSDSTLRGHFPLETDVLADAAAGRGHPYDAVVLSPAYLDAGRVTVGDIHYARIGTDYVPVGETDYATDSAFGYRSSSLPEWVRERAGTAVEVVSLGLDDIRVGGVSRVLELLLSARRGTVVVVNALDDADLEVVALALGEAEATGWRALCRVGPSFVPIRAGVDRRAPLQASEIAAAGARPGRGLVVVGSHVALSSRQLESLLELPGIIPVGLDVEALLDPAGAAVEIDRCAAAMAAAASTADVVLVTSRRRVVVAAGESSLELSRLVSAALVQLTRRLTDVVELGWVIAKGGITSHDIAAHGLDIHRATVLGQLFAGIVSVWRTEPGGVTDTAPAGLPYVVFAGNVGDESTLRDAVSILREVHRA
ncbi:hypothetical protein RHODO2019_18475 (plasmid) [Rhodococcus antarcticus]|uniref:Hydroxyacid dehydrogenase n=1 Tax=Rhodococcus antarcticus TaxID=2987751 RepID=A0ABY6P5C5_9NOCA|nr:four-carbon acid sugar kinase family protein [Rhodococcus antarcticus]UZJ26866.1 hypothetical protein RHODO2019_18475 [Rhodococcus antarcticus]